MLSADQEREVADVLQSHAGTLGNGKQGLFCHMELDADLVGQTLVKTAEHGAAASQPDAVVHDVGIKLGGSLLKGGQNGGLDLLDGFLDAVGNLLI